MSSSSSPKDVCAACGGKGYLIDWSRWTQQYDLIQLLKDSGAIKFGDFTLASGVNWNHKMRPLNHKLGLWNHKLRLIYKPKIYKTKGFALFYKIYRVLTKVFSVDGKVGKVVKCHTNITLSFIHM